MVARLCRFKSCCPHQTRIKRTETIRFVFHILVCNRTCDNAGHCLHTPCAPARCAADASLTRINSPVSLLRSFYSLQVLLSAPKKTIRKGCLFSCGSGLETKLRFVGKRHCVCLLLHAVQLAQRFASKLARLCYYACFTRYKSCFCNFKKPKTNESGNTNCFSPTANFILIYLPSFDIQETVPSPNFLCVTVMPTLTFASISSNAFSAESSSTGTVSATENVSLAIISVFPPCCHYFLCPRGIFGDKNIFKVGHSSLLLAV